nr:hypothetical protein [Actinomycetota bacterium]
MTCDRSGRKLREVFAVAKNRKRAGWSVEQAARRFGVPLEIYGGWRPATGCPAWDVRPDRGGVRLARSFR